MPNLTELTLTNQQLLEELQKRLEKGTIELDVNNEVEPVSEQTSLFSNKYLIAIVIFAIVFAFFYFQCSRQRTNYAFKNTFQIKDKHE